jgi:hypothetical protein
MPSFGGAALKLFQTFNYVLCFACGAIILGFYSYFLSVLADRNIHIPTWEKAVEGISGAGVLYTIFAVVLTCFLGGMRFFAFLAIFLDVLLCAGFVAIAVMTRHGTENCSGNNLNTPLGSGASNSKNGFGTDGFGEGGSGSNVTYSVKLGTACRYNKVCFAVAIIGAFLFLFSALIQLWLGRHHQREKRFGPSPKNNYTSGSGNRWFNRKRGPKTTNAAYAKDAEAGAGGLAVPAAVAADNRHSHETGYTGTTAGDAGTFTGNKYENTNANTHIPTTAGGYHTGPTGTNVNPYGYENRTAGTNF